jgi:putative redox protein
METINKTKELTTTLKLINDRLKFSGIVESNAPVSIDYIPPLGDNQGYTSLELLLLSLSSCIGSAVLVFLRKMQKTITGMEIHAKGTRNEDHPTGFKSIFIQIQLNSPDVNESELKKVIGLAEDKYCPVWAMIKGNVIITFNYNIKN